MESSRRAMQRLKADRSTWFKYTFRSQAQLFLTGILCFSCHRKSTSRQCSTTCNKGAQAGSTRSNQISSVQNQVMRQHLGSAAATHEGTASVCTLLSEVSKVLHRWDSGGITRTSSVRSACVEKRRADVSLKYAPTMRNRQSQQLKFQCDK